MGVASSLVRRDGPLALYRGIGAPMVAYGVINAVAFSTNTTVLRYLREGGGGGRRRRQPRPPAPAPAEDGEETRVAETKALVSNPWIAGLIAGGAAGLTSSFVRGPAERVKTVQQVAESSCGTGKVPEKFRGTIAHGGDVGARARRVERAIHRHGRDDRARGPAVRGCTF